jgi:hypothetical protein
MKKKITKPISFLMLLVAIFLGSCKKNIEVDAPYTSFTGANVFTTDATAISAVTAMYTKLGSAGPSIEGAPIQTVNFYTGLSSDEFTLYPGNSATLSSIYKNDLTVSTAPLLWQQFYQNIYLTNSCVEGLTSSNSLTDAVRQQLLGEAKFMRAFYYFYLVNLYGDVPLVVSANYKLNSVMSRTPSSNVWQQIITDLIEAKDLLNTNFVEADVVTTSASTERVRPNKWTATAFLARVYLYTADYANAEAQATEIINNSSLFSLSTLNNAFLKDPALNKEAIWQIQTVSSGWNTNDAVVSILPATGPAVTTNPLSLNKRLVYSFEANDQRKINWIKGIKVGTDSFYYAFKYKSATLNAPVTEYNIVFRLAEQYLVRAEARAQQNNVGGAQDDLNTIRTRASLPVTTASDKTSLLTAILHERQAELFTEWGHRWFDLKRTNTVDDIMNVEAPLKGGAWQSFDILYPIPQSELIADVNLTQTIGY